MTDLNQTRTAGDRKISSLLLQDRLGSLAGTGEGASESTINSYVTEEVPGGFRLCPTAFIEGDIDLALKTALFVPVGFSVAHQQHPRTALARREALAQMGNGV